VEVFDTHKKKEAKNIFNDTKPMPKEWLEDGDTHKDAYRGPKHPALIKQTHFVDQKKNFMEQTLINLDGCGDEAMRCK
jgi:hypothetical protein